MPISIGIYVRTCVLHAACACKTPPTVALHSGQVSRVTQVLSLPSILTIPVRATKAQDPDLVLFPRKIRIWLENGPNNLKLSIS
jgi:hypothetical protein